MTPGARIAATIELWDEIEKGTAPANTVVSSYFRSRRYAGAKDRRAVIGSVHDTSRREAHLKWWVSQAGDGLDFSARSRVLADLVLAHQHSPEDIQKLFSGSRHCPESITSSEMAFIEKLVGIPLTHPDMPDWVAHEYPNWLDSSFRRLWPENHLAELNGLNVPAPLNLRVNTLKSDRESAIEALNKEDIEAKATKWSPVGLIVTGNPRLGNSPAFQNGLIEIQDEGSQLIAKLTDAKPGMKIVDFCAGAGGKTLALSADMGINDHAKGWITACDISARRLKRMDERLKRAGARNIQTHALNSEQDHWVKENANRVDRLLLDAPCSGTGTWRRSPDAKWRLTPKMLADVMTQQGEILNNAYHLVKPGGRLIYATCSVLQEENEYQIDRFLEKHHNFRALPLKDIWAETVGGDCPFDGRDMRLSPATHGTDGFYVAVLERTT